VTGWPGRILGAWLLCALASGCTGLPEGVEPVQGFELERYLGTWYEIARLDHRFERGLEQTSAEYSLRDDGSLRVVNRGYSPAQGRWKEAEGTARFVHGEDEGYLKVSFFGPFYGAYVVFGLDREQYRYAFVSGNSRDYLWLLARTPVVEREVLERFVTRAGQLGFDTGSLIHVAHDPPAAAADSQ
jgi:apolipoprotein D and lipocalin family protein